MFLMALALIAQSAEYKSVNVVVPTGTVPCVAKTVSKEESKALIRKLRRQGMLVTVTKGSTKRVVTEGIPSGKPSLMRAHIAVSGC